MKIVELRASNFARLSAVEIRPDGAVVPIIGKNSAGKTSVLRAIWTALEGKAAAPARPIHEGAERAVIKLDLGELVVTRTFSRGKHGDITTDLTVVDASRGKIGKTPQAVLDALLGDLTFDPLAFAKLPSKDQVARLRALVPGIDFDAIEREREDTFDARTACNRLAKEKRTLADGIQLPAGPEPEAVDLSGLTARLQAANASNAQVGQMRANVASRRSEAERLRDAAEEWRSDAARLIQKAEDAERIATSTEAEAERVEKTIPAPADTTKIAEQIAAAGQTSRVRRLFEDRRAHEAAAAAHEEQSGNLTAVIGNLDTAVRDAVAKAKLPAGLSFGEGAVLLNGAPFVDAGTAEKIVASLEVGMALNPSLRVLLVDEGSELDVEHLALVAQIAEKNNFQVWICKVAEGEQTVGFRIEDGRVAARQSKEAAE